MVKDFADEQQAVAVLGKPRAHGVTKVVNLHIEQIGAHSDALPGFVDVDVGLTSAFSRKNEFVACFARNLF